MEQPNGAIGDLGRVGYAGTTEHEIGPTAATALRSYIHSASSPCLNG
jgi:hypothetical protein